MELAAKPVVIVGAGRSGTKILRDSLCGIIGAGTWPCDEINYIWRHGNARLPHDEFRREHARPEVRASIRSRFERLARRRGLSHVVEKTCANSLRVEFVDRVLPEALFVFLVRDGRDVVASARKRWKAPLDVPYVLRKARYVPLMDIPYYAWRYVGNRLHRSFTRDGRLATWGPRFAGMDEFAKSEDLSMVCARQWSRCVERMEEGIETIPSERVFRVRYEDFVAKPSVVLNELSWFAGLPASSEQIEASASQVTAGRVGVWREELSEDDLTRVLPILTPILGRYGYSVETV